VAFDWGSSGALSLVVGSFEFEEVLFKPQLRVKNLVHAQIYARLMFFLNGLLEFGRRATVY
jgi:hypothetical protein